MIVSLALYGGVASCSKAPTTPSPATSFSQTDLAIGTGATAASGNSLTVTYTGWLFDPSKPDSKGLVFDTTTGRDPFTFTLGTQQVIAGWDKGIPGMKEGGIRRLVIPPSLAYGDTRQGPIPPNTTLVFDIELVSVQ